MRLNIFMTAIAVVIFFAGPLSAQAAGSTFHGDGYLLRQMDTDKNGVVSKKEFMQFMSRTFHRLDTNRNGSLERNELRPLSGGKWNPNEGHR